MVAHQGSRGPDHSGISQIGNVIFGHNRLAIVDKSEAGNQPINLKNENLFVYNGEVYEWEKLFMAESIAPKVTTDTVAIFWEQMMAAFGDRRVPNKFNGMFAYGFYSDYKKEILIVRDRFGIKPLYYYHSGDVFAFASTPAAVSLVKSDWDISKEGILEYLSLGATQEHSLFDGIKQVPPGHYVTFNCLTHEIKIKRWYFPKFVENAKKEIEERVIKAIDRVKLTCDEPQIILLSGGIDSSLVGSRYTGKSAIHLRSPEQEYAEQVAKKFDIKLHTVDPQESSAETDLTDYITKSGDPTMAGLIPYITCKEIAKQGYRVAITANGADELFFGYNRMTQPFQEQVEHIFRPFALPKFSSTGSDDRFPPSSARQMFEIDTYLSHDLNKTLDFASMCHSVEVRVPFLDHELVEAAMSIPEEKHVGYYGNKTILKKMLIDLGFDEWFVHRPKVGFSLHYSPGDWQSLGDKAMKWYESTDYPQLTSTNGRHQAYHRNTVIGLYLWHKIYKKQ